MNSEFFYELDELCIKHKMILDRGSITEDHDGPGFFLTNVDSGRICGAKPTQSTWNFRVIEYNK